MVNFVKLPNTIFIFLNLLLEVKNLVYPRQVLNLLLEPVDLSLVEAQLLLCILQLLFLNPLHMGWINFRFSCNQHSLSISPINSLFYNLVQDPKSPLQSMVDLPHLVNSFILIIFLMLPPLVMLI